jgi:isopentenyl diphosphate isomerase/L-lactate dehydrogenase-like FMN-dependent dehydrogenase
MTSEEGDRDRAGGTAWLDRLEAEARERLPKVVYDYFAGGAGDERSLADNRAAFGRVAIRPRVLCDVGVRDLAVTVLGGQRLAMPIAVAPMAYHRLAHPDGERASARAAGELGTAFVLSTLATTSLEGLAGVSRGPLWFQLYVFRDRRATRALVERAVAAGASALLVTVDAPILGRRPRDERNRFALPDGMRLGNLEGLDVADLPTGVRGSQLAAHFRLLFDAGLSWDDLAWLRSLSSLPLVLKGILTAEDARLAAEHGADAIVVSNHGARQLDDVVATLDALPEVADAVGGDLEVWMDGGVRSGSDVVKALALGARLVLVGRPVLWGLATGGENGVVEVLTSLRDELDLALALAGCATPAALTRGHVARRHDRRKT